MCMCVCKCVCENVRYVRVCTHMCGCVNVHLLERVCACACALVRLSMHIGVSVIKCQHDSNVICWCTPYVCRFPEEGHPDRNIGEKKIIKKDS